MDPDLRDEIDLEAWEPEAPSAGFAERVVARATAGRRVRRRIVWGVAACAVAAAACVVFLRRTPDSGEITADHRVEVALGARAVAVLEPGAHVAWHGADVTQDRGRVFYRVERGAPFRVHTPAADATVHGTCFGVDVEEKDMSARDLKSAGVGAALSAIAFVGVYEGKVAVAKNGESVELAAGQSARADGSGVRRGGDFDSSAASASGTDEPYVKANQNLVDQIADYQRRLDALESQKKTLGARLADAQEKLASTADGAAPRSKSSLETTQDDWKRFAEDGTIQYAVPCSHDYTPGQATLDKLGLAPQDASIIHDAYARSTKRVWDVIRPICAQELGGAFAVADKLGADSCVHVVIDLERERDGDAASEAMRQVAEIRAGERSAPAASDAVNPVESVFLALTAEPGLFESDLAQTLGPDDAHRIATTQGGVSMCRSTFGGPGPRKQ
ncbi:MAG TPA: FecR domain-containing protein [Polyangiaceae bacterium]|jgi:hypothetical protein